MLWCPKVDNKVNVDNNEKNNNIMQRFHWIPKANVSGQGQTKMSCSNEIHQTM